MTIKCRLLVRAFTQAGARSCSGSLLLTAHRSLLTVLLLLTVHCSLLTVFGQPGVPPLTSPLYGARTKAGSVSTGLPPILKEVGIDQRLNEQVPLDAVFKDDQGREVRLGEYFKGKPVVLALVYYSCPRLCNQILIGTLTSVRQVSFNAGEDYQIVAISFDSRETPHLAAAAKQTYVKAYNHASANAGWHFLTGDDANIKRVTDAVGFRYKWDEKTNQFAHASGVFVTTPEGKLARYFYGIEYPHHWMRLALVEASQNQIGTPVDTLMLYCYHYDPATGKYGASVMNGMKVAGVITVGLIVGMLLKLRRRSVYQLGTKGAGRVSSP
jgi:protein SCO1/2